MKINLMIVILIILLMSFAISCKKETQIIEESQDTFGNVQSETKYVYGSYLYPIDNLEPLPYGLIEEINSIYNGGFTLLSCLNIGVENSDRYLGEISGYYIFFNTVMGSDGFARDSFKTEIIGGYEFFYYQGFNLYAYKEKTLVEVRKLYDSGILSTEQLHEIYLRNYLYEKYFDSKSYIIYKTAISENDLKNINKAWLKKFGENKIYAHSLVDTYKEHLYCFGKIGNAIVFKHPIENNEEDFYQIMIDEIFFRSDQPFQIWVYVNDELITLLEAYNHGVLTFEEIRGLSYVNEIIKHK